MIRKVTLIALASSAMAFQPLALPGAGRNTALHVSTMEAPFYASTTSVSVLDEPKPQEIEAPTPVPTPEGAPVQKKKAPKKKPAKPHGKEGVFSPMVLFVKGVLGDQRLNKVRAKAISLHSDVIATFVDTSDSVFGDAVLRSLFKLADKDGNGTICKDELQTAVKSLGFDWLQEKQVNGIFKRADTDGNGAIDMDEWIKEAPKTLRTNLIKLAKKNGGEMGLLA